MLLGVGVIERRVMPRDFDRLVTDILSQIPFYLIFECFLCCGFGLAFLVTVIFIRRNTSSSLVSGPVATGSSNPVIPVNGVGMNSIERILAINSFRGLSEETDILVQKLASQK